MAGQRSRFVGPLRLKDVMCQAWWRLAASRNGCDHILSMCQTNSGDWVSDILYGVWQERWMRVTFRPLMEAQVIPALSRPVDASYF